MGWKHDGIAVALSGKGDNDVSWESGVVWDVKTPEEMDSSDRGQERYLYPSSDSFAFWLL